MVRTTRAGTPATITLSGTSFVTTAPTATTTLEPIVAPGSMATLAPSHASSPMVTGSPLASLARRPAGESGWPTVEIVVPGPIMQ